MQVRIRTFDPHSSVVGTELLELATLPSRGAELPDGRRVLHAEQVARTAGRNPARQLDVAWWCHELRTLLQAGMTVVEAIDTLQAQVSDPGRAQLQEALLRELRRGRPLSDAMQDLEVFPMVLVASVRASERTSSLPEALTDYLRYHEMVDVLRKKAVSAAIYPTLVLSLGLLVSAFLLVVVLPRFATMYKDLRGQLSWSTQLLVGASRFVHAHQVEVVGILGIALVAGVASWRYGWVHALGAGLGERIGPIRRAVEEFHRAKLYHSLTVMFRGGYTLDESLQRCEGLQLGQNMDASLRQARLAIARGERVSRALSEAELTDVVTQRLLAVGERSGNFDRILQTIAERHAGNFGTFMERATRIVEPLMLLLVALLVGSIVVLMYLPIFDVASSIR
ncbi:type II secretion system F family protein [Paucibacter sp. R3-3]|uniref:Type II secretion system F family protein n=1 Tax=Roseateles agri TaxID=3098619 RepID=A0ABU5DAQ5_9BURK|nr:type II secretion system F family protein [Paucibacter sp. R3-3]MDY0743348.1 type II secretion system F family protein [Paucibacter sp. R3-3]